MVNKEMVRELIDSMGEVDFFKSLSQAVKDREIHEYIESGEDRDDEAYKAARQASNTADNLAWWIERAAKCSAEKGRV